MMVYNEGERTRMRGEKVNQIISILVGVIVIIVLIYLLSSLL
jgi:tetrahydromethanopterin S-methyltransferase subunit G